MFTFQPRNREERRNYYIQKLGRKQILTEKTNLIDDKTLNIIDVDSARSLWLFFDNEKVVKSHQYHFKQYLIDIVQLIDDFQYIQGYSLALQPLYYIFTKEQFLSTSPLNASLVFYDYQQLLQCSVNYILNSINFQGQEKQILNYAFHSILNFVDSQLYELILDNKITQQLGSATLAPAIFSMFQSLSQSLDECLQFSLFSIQADLLLHLFVASASISLTIRFIIPSAFTEIVNNIKINEKYIISGSFDIGEVILTSLNKGCLIITNFPFHAINFGVLCWIASVNSLDDPENHNFKYVTQYFSFYQTFINDLNLKINLSDLAIASYDTKAINEKRFTGLCGDLSFYYALLNESIRHTISIK